MTNHSVVIAGGGPTGAHARRRIGAGGSGRRRRRAPAQSGTLRRACPRNLLAHHRSTRPARHRGPIPLGGTNRTGHGLRRHPLGHQRLPTCHNYGLALRQKHVERILAGWVTELKVPILYGREITGFVQHDAGVDVALADGQSLRAQYLVGCDGGRSLVRRPRASTSRVGSNPAVTKVRDREGACAP